MTTPADAPAPATRRLTLRSTARLVEHMLAAVGLLFLLYWGCFDLTVMAEGSMQPTLQGDRNSGDYVLSEKVSGWFSSPDRWDVVAFSNDDGIRVMKRVVGLPGETVGLRDMKLLIDGKPVDFPAKLSFLRYYDFGNLSKGQTVACGSGYFVMGDDSRDSQDSRFEGPINPGRFTHRAWARVWPMKRMGWVEP